MRFPVTLAADVFCGEQGVLGGQITNLSRFGFTVRGDYFPCEPSALLSLKIKHPLEERYIDARAEVVWKRSVEGKCELGVRVQEIAPEQKADLLAHGFDLWREKESGVEHN